MTYKEYPECKTYVIINSTGCGVMEDPSIDQGVVCSYDTMDEAQAKCEDLVRLNNTEESIKSTWYRERFHVDINTLTVEGMMKGLEFGIEFDDIVERAKAAGAKEYKVDGNTIYFVPMPGWNDKPKDDD